jgi:phosphatidate cytidylyltransferase
MMSNLALRTLSAVALAPLALAVVWAGPPWVTLLAAIGVVLLVREWARMCQNGAIGLGGYALGAVGLGVVALSGMDEFRLALLLALLGGLATYAAARYTRAPHPRTLALGALYLGVPCAAFVWLDSMPGQGLAHVLWLFAVVWGSDIGAYACGRLIGGPKLAPRISPNKTWAGFFGGIGAAVLGSLAVGVFYGTPQLALMAALGAILSLISQGGDLLESQQKRRFGVKDSGRLIPGHGGLLDRLDSLLTTTPALAALVGTGLSPLL